MDGEREREMGGHPPATGRAVRFFRRPVQSEAGRLFVGLGSLEPDGPT